MTRGQAIIHTVLPNHDAELSLWYDPLLTNDIPVRDVIP